MSAGDDVNWPDVGVRVATTTLAVASSTYAGTESGALMSVTASLVNGWTYAVTAWMSVQTTAVSAPEISLMRIREDTATGTQDQFGDVLLSTTTGNGWPVYLYAEYPAGATGNKVFVVTGQRTSGTGTHSIIASSNRQAYLTVQRIVS